MRWVISAGIGGSETACTGFPDIGICLPCGKIVFQQTIAPARRDACATSAPKPRRCGESDQEAANWAAARPGRRALWGGGGGGGGGGPPFLRAVCRTSCLGARLRRCSRARRKGRF